MPYYWPSYAQYMDEAGVDWKCFQDSYDNADTNQLVHFAAFQNATEDSSLYQRGLLYDGDNGLEGFKARAANGTLPLVSYIFAPSSLQEHSPKTPNDAAWFMNEVIGSVINGTGYNESVILLNYDGKLVYQYA
jgi:phospholipase C